MFNRKLALLCILALFVSVGSWQTAQAQGGIGRKVIQQGLATIFTGIMIFGGAAALDADAHGVTKVSDMN